jgi:hypothetical protein
MIRGDQAGCLLRAVFAVGEDGWDMFSAVVAAAVLTVAPFPFPSYGTSAYNFILKIKNSWRSFTTLGFKNKVLKAGAVGANGGAPGLVFVQQVPRMRTKHVPREDYGVRPLFALFSGCSRVFRSHHSWQLQRMNTKNLQSNS